MCGFILRDAKTADCLVVSPSSYIYENPKPVKRSAFSSCLLGTGIPVAPDLNHVYLNTPAKNQ